MHTHHRPISLELLNALAIFLLILLPVSGCGHEDGSSPQVDSGAAVQAKSSENSAIVFKNCSVITMAEEEVLQDYSVVVLDNKITAVGPTKDVAAPESAQVIDCEDQYLLPGFTDAHVHIGHETELLSYLRHGVTTVFNLSGDYVDLFSDDRLDIRSLRDAVNRGEVQGSSILTAGQSLDGDPPTGPFQKSLDSASAARQAVKEQQQAGYDFIKVYDSLNAEQHKAIIEAARENGMPVLGHIPEALGVQDTLTSGQQIIAHAEEFYPRFENAQNQKATIETLVREIKVSGVTVIPNIAFIRRLILQLEDLDKQLARPEVDRLSPRVKVWWKPKYNYYVNRENKDEFLDQTRQKYGWLLPLVAELHRQQVPLLTGSDASIPVALPGISLHDELDDLVKAGLSPYEAIRTCTANIQTFATRYLPQQTPFGTIQVGNRADLVLISSDPLSDITNLRKTVGVMARGQWSRVEALEDVLGKATADF